MAVSQNGWSAFTDYSQPGLTSNPTVPGTDVKILGGLRSGAVLTVMLYAASRWHREVEPLVQDLGQWGFGPRDIRGSTELSNHASGTAIDLNAVKHPLGTDPAGNFTADQIFTIRKIITDLGGVLRWGGDYYGRKDGMHLEINSGPGQVEAMAQKIRAGQVPNVHPDLVAVIEVKPSPSATRPPSEEDIMTPQDKEDIAALVVEKLLATRIEGQDTTLKPISTTVKGALVQIFSIGRGNSRIGARTKAIAKKVGLK